MQILINTDNHINASDAFNEKVAELLRERFRRFDDRITRIEVHFNDENSSAKSYGNDKRCVLEVRMNGMNPLAVTANTSEVMSSLRSAIDKMRSQIDSTLGRLEEAR
ncbi:MAG: HPF/RaiA family ribosome-associated protein [Pirellula sp.]|jgi:ribosomal subunit interface protein|nr:HPF/RaiA family ribosome-associated protein [Pirellula sp.]